MAGASEGVGRPQGGDSQGGAETALTEPVAVAVGHGNPEASMAARAVRCRDSEMGISRPIDKGGAETALTEPVAVPVGHGNPGRDLVNGALHTEGAWTSAASLNGGPSASRFVVPGQ